MRRHTRNIKATRAKYKTRNTVIISSVKFLCSCVSAVIPVDPSQPERGLIHVGSGVPGAVRFQIVNQHGLRPPFVRSFLFTYADRITDSIQQLYTEFLVVNLAPNNNIVPPPPPPPGQPPLPAGQPPLPVSQPPLPVVQVPVVTVGQVHPPADPSPSSPPRPSLLNPPYMQAQSLPPVSSSGPDIEVLWERRTSSTPAAAAAGASTSRAAAPIPRAAASTSRAAASTSRAAAPTSRAAAPTSRAAAPISVSRQPAQAFDARKNAREVSYIDRPDRARLGSSISRPDKRHDQRHDVVSRRQDADVKRPIFDRLGPANTAGDRTAKRRRFIEKARSRKGQGGRVERESCRGNGGGVARNVGRRGGGVKPSVKAQRHEEHESDGTL